MFGLIWTTGIALAAFSFPAEADQYDSTPLFGKGAWAVNHTYDTMRGNSWCVAETSNRLGQWFSVVAYASGDAVVFVGDPSWDLSERAVRYRIDIDYERWDIGGAARGSAVSVHLTGNDEAAAFVGQLMSRSAVAAYSDDGIRLATFSLDGSYAAIGALFECWARIAGGDPFTRASDPF